MSNSTQRSHWRCRTRFTNKSASRRPTLPTWLSGSHPNANANATLTQSPESVPSGSLHPVVWPSGSLACFFMRIGRTAGTPCLPLSTVDAHSSWSRPSMQMHRLRTWTCLLQCREHRLVCLTCSLPLLSSLSRWVKPHCLGNNALQSLLPCSDLDVWQHTMHGRMVPGGLDLHRRLQSHFRALPSTPLSLGVSPSS